MEVNNKRRKEEVGKERDYSRGKEEKSVGGGGEAVEGVE